MSKKTIGSLVGALVVIILLCVMFLHPVNVLSDSSYRWSVKVTGIKYDIEGVGFASGGYRVYLTEEEYLWFSENAAELSADPGSYIRWGLPWQLPKINAGA